MIYRPGGKVLAFALNLCIILASGPVKARAGDGIRVGEFRVSPLIELESLLETNTRHSYGGEEADIAFGAKPSLKFTLDGADSYFDASAFYYLLKYSGLFGYDHSDIDIFDNGGARGLLKINRRGKFIPVFSGDFYNLAYPREEFSQIDKNLLYKLHGDGSFQATYAPRPTLEVKLKGIVNYDRYSTPTMRINKLTSPSVNIQPKWRFFPRTATLIDASLGYFYKEFYPEAAYYYGDPAEGLGTGYTTLPDAFYYKAKLGLTGQISSKVQLQILAGYGEADYEAEENQITGEILDEDVKNEDGIIGSLLLKWNPSPTTKFNLQFRRDFVDSYFSNFYVGNSVSGEYEGLFINKFGIKATATGSFIEYHGAVMRSDVVMNIFIDFTYQPNPWLQAHLKYVFDWLDSTLTEVNYTDHRLYLVLALKY